LFSLEEVMGDLHAPLLGSVVLSSATSWMVLHLLLGDEPLFHVPAYHLVHSDRIRSVRDSRSGRRTRVRMVCEDIAVAARMVSDSAAEHPVASTSAGGLIVGIMG